MGGAQFFWRVTLLKGSGRQGVFQVEEHTMPRNKPRPSEIPYKKRGPPISYDGLSRIPYVGDEISRASLALSSTVSQAEFYHDRYMPI